ncbi:MAG: aldo/keto reductase [Myxococcales bacterium]
MDLTRTAYGTWSGGRFMHFGEPLPEKRFLTAIRHAYEKGIRTFMTADVYSNGGADEMLARVLSGYPRDSYALVGMIGHDFYQRPARRLQGLPALHPPAAPRPARIRRVRPYSDRESAAERCKTDHLDCLMLHNPDSIG